MGLVGLVPLCHRAFAGPKFFLMGISCVQNFFSLVFRGSKNFYRGYILEGRERAGCRRRP